MWRAFRRRFYVFQNVPKEDSSMMKRTLTAAALASVLAVPAFAQTAAPSATTPSATTPTTTMTSPSAGANFMQSQQATDWRGSKLIGATVYGSDNASIGEVNDLVLTSDGKVNGVVIGVGGFLGVGSKNVAVAFDKLHVTRKPNSAAVDKITVAFSKDELKNAPTFAFYEPAPTSTTGSATGDRTRSKPLSPSGSPTAPRQ
jgi:sporulation protein YlmC with PRC-barrel domain